MFTIQWLSDKFSICKLPDLEEVRQKNQFSFLSITDEEISYVCPTHCVPKVTVSCEDGFRGFRIEGILDFSLIGILAPISVALAEAQIGIFVVSTFNTDYVFVKEENVAKASQILYSKQYRVIV